MVWVRRRRKTNHFEIYYDSIKFRERMAQIFLTCGAKNALRIFVGWLYLERPFEVVAGKYLWEFNQSFHEPRNLLFLVGFKWQDKIHRSNLCCFFLWSVMGCREWFPINFWYKTIITTLILCTSPFAKKYCQIGEARTQK